MIAQEKRGTHIKITTMHITTSKREYAEALWRALESKKTRVMKMMRMGSKPTKSRLS
jgi:prephenate dehydratase